MGRRCGCVGDECNCRITPGRGVGLSGDGSQSNPLEVSQSAAAYLRAASTDDTVVGLQGTGSIADPYLLSMDFVGETTSPPLSIRTFRAPGTYQWFRPTGCDLIEVTCI